MELRRKNEPELHQILKEWVLHQDKEDIYHKLQNISTIAGYVAEPEDLLQSNQLLEREYFNNQEGMLYPGIPFVIDDLRPTLDKAPLLGENNIDIVDVVKTKKAKEFQKIAKKCTCTFECANAINTDYDPKHWISLIN